MELTVVVVILASLLALAQYAYALWKQRADTQLCHVQQGRLQELINGTPGIDLDSSIEDVFKVLVSSKMLEGRLDASGDLVSIDILDPGHGAGSYANYYITPDESKRIACREHGLPADP